MSTIYFRVVAKDFDLLLSVSYVAEYCKIVSKVLSKIFCNNNCQIMIFKLLKCRFLQKPFRTELIFICNFFFFSIMLLWDFESPPMHTAYQNPVSGNV